MDLKILDLLLALLPALLVGLIAFYFFNLHTKNEESRRRFLLHRENQKQALPLRLQAYERMALLLERISPGNILLRVAPISDDKDDYETLLSQTIEQEFEHNITQQIYISDECWNIIRTAKNTTITLIRKTKNTDEVTNAEDLRKVILTKLVDNTSPSDAALEYLKKELNDIF